MKKHPKTCLAAGGVMLCSAPLYKGCETKHTYGAPIVLRKLCSAPKMPKLRSMPARKGRFCGKGVLR